MHLQTRGLRGSRGLSPIHRQPPPCSEKPEPGPARGWISLRSRTHLFCSVVTPKATWDRKETSVKALAPFHPMRNGEWQVQVPSGLKKQALRSPEGSGGLRCRHSVLHAQTGQPAWATGSRVCLLKTRAIRNRSKANVDSGCCA